MQKYISLQAKTHKRQSIVALKIVVNKETQVDSKAISLAKNELQKTHLKDFEYNISKYIIKV